MKAVPYIRVGDAREVWFAAKPIASWLGYVDTEQAIRINVTERHRKPLGELVANGFHKMQPQTVFITQAGLLMLLMKSQRSVLEETAEAKANAASVEEIAQELRDCRIAEKDRSGHIYAVTSPLLNAVKLGRWGGSLQRLRYRYTGIYGDSIVLYTSQTSDSHAAEAQMHCRFARYRLSNELFSKDGLEGYVAYIHGRRDSTPPAAPSAGMERLRGADVRLEDVSHLLGDQETTVDSAPQLLPAQSVYEQHFGWSGDSKTVRLLGKRIAEEYRRRHGESPPRKRVLQNGYMRDDVKAYSLADDAWIPKYMEEVVSSVSSGP